MCVVGWEGRVRHKLYFPIIQIDTNFRGLVDGFPTQYPTLHQTHPNPPIEANDTDMHR